MPLWRKPNSGGARGASRRPNPGGTPRPVAVATPPRPNTSTSHCWWYRIRSFRSRRSLWGEGDVGLHHFCQRGGPQLPRLLLHGEYVATCSRPSGRDAPFLNVTEHGHGEVRHLPIPATEHVAPTSFLSWARVLPRTPGWASKVGPPLSTCLDLVLCYHYFWFRLLSLNVGNYRWQLRFNGPITDFPYTFK